MLAIAVSRAMLNLEKEHPHLTVNWHSTQIYSYPHDGCHYLEVNLLTGTDVRGVGKVVVPDKAFYCSKHHMTGFVGWAAAWLAYNLDKFYLYKTQEEIDKAIASFSITQNKDVTIELLRCALAAIWTALEDESNPERECDAQGIATEALDHTIWFVMNKGKDITNDTRGRESWDYYLEKKGLVV